MIGLSHVAVNVALERVWVDSSVLLVDSYGSSVAYDAPLSESCRHASTRRICRRGVVPRVVVVTSVAEVVAERQRWGLQCCTSYRRITMVRSVVLIGTLASTILLSGVHARLAAPPLLQNFSLCERLHPEDLPEQCSCREPGNYNVVIECLKYFESPFNDTIGMKIDLDPCNAEGSKISIDVTEANHGIDFPVAGVRAGEERNIPIPGLAIAVPGVGHVGVDVAVLIVGNPDMLTLKVGLNACVAIASKMVCASSIPGLDTILPWYVLSGTYSFGDVCNSTTAYGVSLMARQPKVAVS